MANVPYASGVSTRVRIRLLTSLISDVTPYENVEAKSSPFGLGISLRNAPVIPVMIDRGESFARRRHLDRYEPRGVWYRSGAARSSAARRVRGRNSFNCEVFVLHQM